MAVSQFREGFARHTQGSGGGRHGKPKGLQTLFADKLSRMGRTMHTHEQYPSMVVYQIDIDGILAGEPEYQPPIS
jgi:hypothetical protein